MGVGQPQGMLLNLFGEQLRHAFGHMAYHVGSSLRQKDGWRDVDVRMLLDDEEWDAFMLGSPENPHRSPRWRTLCIVWSTYGRHMTGLPIDFQLQQRTHANANYKSANGCLRSALFVSDAENLRDLEPGLFHASGVEAEALVPQPEKDSVPLSALFAAGIVDDHGTLRWVFRPNETEVSSSGGTLPTRVTWLLNEVRYLIDDMIRRRQEVVAPPPPAAGSTRALVKRCNDFLALGGLWNAELMPPDKISMLVLDCRDGLESALAALVAQTETNRVALVAPQPETEKWAATLRDILNDGASQPMGRLLWRLKLTLEQMELQSGLAPLAPQPPQETK